MSQLNEDKKRILSSKEGAGVIKDMVLEVLDEDKGEDILAIDLEGKTDFAHFMVLATGRSSKHVVSLADSLVEKLIEMGMDGVNVSGRERGDWVLIDAIDVVIHVFRAETREVYRLEKIWAMDSKHLA